MGPGKKKFGTRRGLRGPNYHVTNFNFCCKITNFHYTKFTYFPVHTVHHECPFYQSPTDLNPLSVPRFLLPEFNKSLLSLLSLSPLSPLHSLFRLYTAAAVWPRNQELPSRAERSDDAKLTLVPSLPSPIHASSKKGGRRRRLERGAQGKNITRAGKRATTTAAATFESYSSNKLGFATKNLLHPSVLCPALGFSSPLSLALKVSNAVLCWGEREREREREREKASCRHSNIG